MVNKGSTGSEPRNLIVDLLMGFIFLLLISFSLWLIWLTFFREYFDTGMTEDNGNDTFQSVSNLSGGRSQRFHFAADSMAAISPSSSLCLKCHEDLPHRTSREKRAFLNAHGYFMTCEVCHIRFDEKSQMVYRWLDEESGRYYGQRSIDKTFRIAPLKQTIDGNYVSFETLEEKQFVMAYQEDEGRYGKAMRDAALERVHKKIASKPISCVDCHTHEQVSLLPLSELAYSEDRINELSRIEVAGMVMKYEHFFLPNLMRGTNE